MSIYLEFMRFNQLFFMIKYMLVDHFLFSSKHLYLWLNHLYLWYPFSWAVPPT